MIFFDLLAFCRAKPTSDQGRITMRLVNHAFAHVTPAIFVVFMGPWLERKFVIFADLRPCKSFSPNFNAGWKSWILSIFGRSENPPAPHTLATASALVMGPA